MGPCLARGVVVCEILRVGEGGRDEGAAEAVLLRGWAGLAGCVAVRGVGKEARAGGGFLRGTGACVPLGLRLSCNVAQGGGI